jgi:granule-bound starch synthase
VGVEGIVNGMSADDWTPASDAYLASFGAVNYDKDSFVAGKAAAKAALQAEVGLPVDPAAPLFGFVGRLEEQKGVDVLLASLPAMLGGSGGGAPRPQVVVLGTGKAALEAEVEGLADRFPGAAAGVAAFNTPLAHLLFAGCDGLLIPSRFEPCGLIQLQAMAYGALPIVASTGGLVDTVKDGVTGFHLGRALNPDALDPEDAAALAATARKAAALYGTPAFTAMQATAIGQDLSWSRPALKWEAVLSELVDGAGVDAGKKESVITPAAAV